LGKGGFGTVFRCKNALDGREYAIKKIFIRYDTRLPEKDFSQRLQRTLREVKSLALLDHPNIVRYYTAWLEIDTQKTSGENGDSAADAAGASDYYLMSPTNTTLGDGKATTNPLSSPISSTSDWLGQRRPSLEHHLNNSTHFNPLGGGNWNGDESFSQHMMLQGIPAALDDYGFTFDRSETLSVMQQGESMTTSPTTVTVEGEKSTQNGFFAGRRHSFSSAASVGSSIECSTSAWSRESRNQEEVTQGGTEVREKTAPNTAAAAAWMVKHTLYIQMQFCSQKTLADFLANEEARRGPSAGGVDGGVDIPYALDLFLQIAQGVKHVHSQGLIHRDLKPNNCFIDDAGVVKVGDFGLSRESGETSDVGDDTTTIATAADGGEITAGVGTRSYASPEQMKGSDYDSSTDVYSLGIILFELCYPMYTVSRGQGSLLSCLSKESCTVF
jgi:serine/threonine protein kinase